MPSYRPLLTGLASWEQPEVKYDTISFLSDYGHRDEFVGVVKSVIRSIAPAVAVIDITHDIDPFDIRGGGLALARSAQYLAPGVVIAAVDPTAGSSRRCVAVEVGDGSAVLVGPDNGVLAPAVALVGGASRAVSLTNTELHLPAIGTTFAGRDILGPVAAHLCGGVDFAELGDPVEPAVLMPGVLPVSEAVGDEVVAEVLWIDRFGNVQLNADPLEVAPFGQLLNLTVNGRGHQVHRVGHFDEIPPGSIGLMEDAYGLLSIVAQRASAAEQVDIAAGDELRLREAGAPVGVGTPLSLSPRKEQS